MHISWELFAKFSLTAFFYPYHLPLVGCRGCTVSFVSSLPTLTSLHLAVRPHSFGIHSLSGMKQPESTDLQGSFRAHLFFPSTRKSEVRETGTICGQQERARLDCKWHSLLVFGVRKVQQLGNLFHICINQNKNQPQRWRTTLSQMDMSNSVLSKSFSSSQK